MKVIRNMCFLLNLFSVESESDTDRNMCFILNFVLVKVKVIQKGICKGLVREDGLALV